MAYEYLTDLFGSNEDGTPKALTASQLVDAISANKNISIVNLKEGGYVSAEKFSRMEGERNALQEKLQQGGGHYQQELDEARQQIADLQGQLNGQIRKGALKDYLNGFKFTSSLAKEGILAAMEKDESICMAGDELIGADKAMEKLSAKYADAFIAEEEPKQPEAGAVAPNFTSTGSMASRKPEKMGLLEAMRYKNQHPNADISTLF